MREDAERYYAGHRGIATLIAGLLLPPAAWMVHLSGSFVVASALCERGGPMWPLHLVTVPTAAIALTGGYLAWRNWHDTGEDTNPDEGGTLARSKFLALAGLASGAFFTFAIIIAEVSTVLLASCTH